MKKLGALLVAAILCCVTSAQVFAVNTNFGVQIVPLECQFEVVDSGTNQIVYLTPEECGQVIDPVVQPSEPNGPDEPQGEASDIVTSPSVGFDSSLFTYFPYSEIPIPSIGRDTSPSSSDEVIDLDLYSAFSEGDGMTMELEAGQSVQFAVGGQTQTVTVIEITSDSVMILLSGKPSALADESRRVITLLAHIDHRYDISRDGVDDTQITLRGIDNNKAKIFFKHMLEHTLAGEFVAKQSSDLNLPLLLLVSLPVIGLVVSIYKRRP